MVEYFPFLKWDFKNKTGIGSRFKALEIVYDFSKPNWIWFGIFRTLTMAITIFQTNLNLVWNLRLAKSFFFLSKPNCNWFGKLYAIFGCNFSKPNWIWFGKGHWIKCSGSQRPDQPENINSVPIIRGLKSDIFDWDQV